VNLLNLIVLAGLAGVTAVYACYRQKMAGEMREQRMDAVRPVLDIRMHPTADHDRLGVQMATRPQIVAGGLSCRCANVGLGAAVDVRSQCQVGQDARLYDMGTIGIGQEASSARLALEQDSGSYWVRVQYKDVFGRDFESRRALVGGPMNWQPGPLQVRQVEPAAGQLRQATAVNLLGQSTGGKFALWNGKTSAHLAEGC
jgi:hypothetical protein